ncbi:rub (nucleomorph) [Hemiselmis andersenii]|uniref:Rub n=1 Tax=Hemiselmis andersenii TaxID=464988 RepID=A9BKV4_HEMAN|nr:rub [Hemiselmis andersenii]ABW98109.1 rub [Hemiselmis andersenii]|mmetsp:Transcript_26497/g.61397  ORF Transcript_26497/g.61397 Transcript_26497/m.61397 type:complete len:175 (+) Transcript_26497:764-1288(+)
MIGFINANVFVSLNENKKILKKPFLNHRSNSLSKTRFESLKMNSDEILDPETRKERERQKEIERLRAAEKFMEIDEGKFECQACGYVYEPEKGDRFAGIEPGTAFTALSSDFNCPACRSPKSQFKSIKKTIAGFAENQKYGLGGNSLTGDQKNFVIFGILGLAFLLLLSGYLLE